LYAIGKYTPRRAACNVEEAVCVTRNANVILVVDGVASNSWSY
jgi:hypothetical protein